MKATALISLLALSACASIDTTQAPPVDWPALKVIENYGHTEQCAALGLTLACAFVNFKTGVCTIYYGASPAAFIVEHERAHCKGYDHYLETTMRDAWSEHKRTR